jgi:hypothetical protein
MNIAQELDKRGTEYEIDDSGCMLRIFDAEDNLGIMLQFDRFELTYHFWDANGCSYSPTRPFTTLDEMFEQFDKLILIYYGVDDPAVFEPYFKDWKPIQTEA